MITAITIITVATVVLTGYSLGYVTGSFYNNEVTKDYLTEVATQTSNKIIHDIRGGLNGIRNAVDNNHEAISESRKTIFEIIQSLIRATEYVTQKNESKPVQDIDWSSFMENDNECDYEDTLLDPKPEIYHNQEVRLGNQSEITLRKSIDKLWQKAYANCCTKRDTENAYYELGRVHRQLSAIILKAQKGKNI